MIKTIQSKSVVINVNNEVSKISSHKLYSADSMTLIVGKNGSGKTETLTSIYNGLIKGNNKTLEITFSEDDSKENKLVIYYSSSPFGEKKLLINDNAESITPEDFKRNKIPKEYSQMASSLKSYFGIDADPKLELMSFNRSDLYRFQNIIDRRRNYIDEDDLKKHNEKFGGDLFKSSNEDFFNYLRKINGDGFAKKMRAYKYATYFNNKSELGYKHLFELLGFKLKIPNENPSVIKNSFLHAISILDKISIIVDDNLLQEVIYDINLEKAEKLGAVNMGLLGQISLGKMSSGSAALLHQFSSIKISIDKLYKKYSEKKDLVLLIDEGDAFLHVEWQRKYIDYLDRFIDSIKTDFRNVQVFIATHSPFLMSDFPSENICLLNSDDILSKSNITQSNNRTFAAPLEYIVKEIGKTSLIGEFSKRNLFEIINSVKFGSEVDLNLIEIIGDPIIRKELIRIIKTR